jgi:hypothetical protein
MHAKAQTKREELFTSTNSQKFTNLYLKADK